MVLSKCETRYDMGAKYCKIGCIIWLAGSFEAFGNMVHDSENCRRPSYLSLMVIFYHKA